MAPPDRWYRVHFQWGILACFGGVVLLALGAMVLGGNHPPPVGVRVVAGLLIPPLIGYGAYTFTAGIAADESGVTVRQWRLRTRHIPWARVSGFRALGTADSRSSDYVAVDTTDGRTWMTSGLMCQRRSKAQQFVEALEADRKKWAAARWWE